MTRKEAFDVSLGDMAAIVETAFLDWGGGEARVPPLEAIQLSRSTARSDFPRNVEK